ncbi:hypothetical protein LR48_Vigan09g202900 [Vigna angularis]|uniref:Uncharacterized protein n=2 Tax=Phaseolus angularis TaxID=3914 RepID=A0A0L9VE88_PHAAN|nr:hypothetical protein LR48_Vigan09g202900 [Vigna angularis]BAT89119.1 hypothetical protein VIGAN_05281300 [Vigna angularis var. angularis]
MVINGAKESSSLQNGRSKLHTHLRTSTTNHTHILECTRQLSVQLHHTSSWKLEERTEMVSRPKLEQHHRGDFFHFLVVELTVQPLP